MFLRGPLFSGFPVSILSLPPSLPPSLLHSETAGPEQHPFSEGRGVSIAEPYHLQTDSDLEMCPQERQGRLRETAGLCV